jgi:hypothetical protein
MELQQFVASALKQLIGAIDEVKEFAKSKGAEINPSTLTWVDTGHERQLMYDESTGMLCSEVEFDLAVTISEGSTKAGGGGISVAALEFGAKGEKKAANEYVSRIKFMVPVVLPGTKPKPRSDDEPVK